MTRPASQAAARLSRTEAGQRIDPDRIRRDLLRWGALGLAAAAARPVRASGDTDAGLLSTYGRFVGAQNAGDLETVRSLFTETPRFLWVSDGQSIWGRDAAIERMSLFRRSEVWHVTPALDEAVAVTLGPQAAYLHLPLDLAIGARDPGPDLLHFLVSMLCHRGQEGEPWRIAALFTTMRKMT